MPQLTNLDVEWVSLVDRAAVRDPVKQTEPMRFLVWKRDTTTSKGDEMKFTDELLKQLGEPVEKEAALEEFVEKADAGEDVGGALKAAARVLAAHKGDLPEGSLAELCKAVGLEVPTEKAETPELKTAAELVDHLKKSEISDEVVAEVEKALEEVTKKAEINKADLPQPVREALEKAESEAAESRREAAEAAKIAKAERDARLNKEFVAKAEGFKGLAVNAEKFGPILKAANEKLSKEEYEALETVLRAANNGIETGELFKEQGRGGVPAAGDAATDLQRKAGELKKSDSKLSQAEAEDQVLKSDPDLQARYLAEMQGR
jgi:hypothetical protein